MHISLVLYKYRHPVRLFLTAAVCLLIPFFVYFAVLFSRSYREVIAAKEEQIVKITQFFRGYFQGQIFRLYNTAIRISVDSRNSRERSYILQSRLFGLNPYYYVDCIEAIGQYAKDYENELCIYFPGADCLITQRYKYDAGSFIKNYLAITDDGISGKIESFLRETGNSIAYCSTFPEQYEKGLLLLGVPVRMGINREPALVFLILDSSSMDVSSFYAGEEGAIQFCVVNNESGKLEYSTGTFFPAPLRENMKAWVSRNSVQYETIGTSRYRIFTIQDDIFNNTYMSVMPFDRISRSIYSLNRTMLRTAAIFLVLLLLSICVMVYFNYKPIRDEMSGKNNTILGLLLGNLLYGAPVPENEAEQLGLSRPPGLYTVFVLFGLKFKTEERKILSTDMYEQFMVTSFITDILYQNYTVIICLLPSRETAALAAWIKTRLPESTEMAGGPVVNSLSDIKISFQSCLKREGLKKHKAFEEKIQADPETKELRDRVICYVEENCNNPLLSQTMVGDHFGFSIYSLSRLFNNDIGVGFSEFIITRRMEQAKKLLLETAKDIPEIAKAVGITNTNYFYRSFKSHFGVTPTHYRAENR